MKIQFRAIDLFSGCGGLTTGLKKAGFDVLAAAEILPHARSTYALNHPNVHFFEDIRKVSGKNLLSTINLKKGELDLLAGCPPCQGFSTLKKLNRAAPAKDQRNELIFDFVRLVRELRPKTVMMENVPGLMTDSRMDKTRARLKKLGYFISLAVLDAADFGVPQRRKRMIMIASLYGTIPLPKSKGKAKKTVRQAIGKLTQPKKSKNKLHRILSEHSDSVRQRIRLIPHDGGSRKDLGAAAQLDCHKKLNAKVGGGFSDIYGRLHWDKVSSTITRYCTNPSKGRFLHPTQNRALTVYEAALLQSFPKNYKFDPEMGILKLSSMIGEALPPLFAEAQAKSIKRHLEAVRSKQR